MIEALQTPRLAPVSELPLDPTERILARVRLRAQLRILWLRALWRREKDAGVRSAITHAEVDACLEGWDRPEAEAAFLRGSGEARALADTLSRIEDAIAADRGSRLAALVTLFELTAQENDLLQACFAVSLDPALGRAFAYIQDIAARAYPTEEAAARLFGHGYARAFEAESALRRWGLVIAEVVGPGEPRALSCDPMVRAWLLGGRRLDEPLSGVARLLAHLPPLPCWPVDETAARIDRVLESGDRLRLLVTGTPGSGRRTFAAAVAAKLDLPLLSVNSDAVDDEAWPRVFLHAQRQAYLDRCALAWTGERVLRSRWPQLTYFPVQFVIAEPGQAPLALPNCLDDAVEMPKLSLAERAGLWRELVPGAAQWSGPELQTLVARHRLVVGEIAELGRRPITTAAQAAQAVRAMSRHRLGELARFVECPFDWDDLVLPDTLRLSLTDFVYEAEERAAFWEQRAPNRLFPQGQGLFALFSGAPGTGKTMAAQVIAARLGLDLFRISLASVVSKYVGETSKNLHRIFARAEEMDAVILFDEADALFGKRTEIKDAHDRFANTDTNYLLQAIEAYRGIALLATNKKANVDAAFMRRIRYVLDFPKPEAAERRKLWAQLVAELAGADRAQQLAHALDTLAQSIETTGAQIKFAVLTALFAARRDGQALGIEHLLRGLERELIKEGRALTERDRERLRAS